MRIRASSAKSPSIGVQVMCYAAVAALFLALPAVARAQHEFDPETWIALRHELGPKGPVPPVAEDIAALALGRDSAKRAGPRLIARGPEILPDLHAALLEPGTSAEQAFLLLQVLRSIGDSSSVSPIITALKRDPDHLHKAGFLALSMLPPTDEAVAFATALAEREDESWRKRRMAFTYFGMQRDSRGRKWAEPLLASEDPEQRAAGLFVLARLGDAGALEPITQLLAEGATPNSRGSLMFALAELVGPEEFLTRAPSGFEWSSDYREPLHYATARAGSETERPAACVKLLRAMLPGLKGVGVRCLLERGLEKELLPPLALDMEVPGLPALLRAELRKAGYQLIDTESEFRITRAEPPSAAEPCEQAGGSFGPLGLLGTPTCNLPTPDANKPCSDGSQCVSACVAPETAAPESRSWGTCYGHRRLLGSCLKQVRGGVVEPAVCVD